MMASVVAMASVIEDFDTQVYISVTLCYVVYIINLLLFSILMSVLVPIQPCKKSQNDGGSPVGKTIADYFPSVPKPLEKPFSPPRPNKIMDYFTRKAPTKTSSPEQVKDDCQKSRINEKPRSLETEVKKPLQKRSRKCSKRARRLVEAETSRSTEQDCVIIEEQRDERESSAQTGGRVLSGDDVINPYPEAGFPGKKLDIMATETVSEKSKHHEDESKIPSKLDIIELSPIVSSTDKAEKVRSDAPHARRKQQQQEEIGAESTLCDVSMEVNVDETSHLNSSTVTISFEEFVRSQSQDIDEEDVVDDIPAGNEEMDTNSEEIVPSGEPALQGSPQTVTVHAEVHVVSPMHDAVAAKKVASIFNRRKGATSSTEPISPAQMEARRRLPSSAPLLKRKSNVVLEEDDLELAVLESESTPKCTDTEKKQFMAAFKQPALDGSKTKPGKSLGKAKQQIEKVEDITEKETDSALPPPAEEAPLPSKKAAKNKLARKGQKRKENETVSTSPSLAKEVASTVDGGKTPTIPVSSSPSTPPTSALRRSARGAAVRQTSTPETPIRRPRQPSESRSAAVHSPAKTGKSKHGVFKAEMVCPPDVEQSPIR